MRPAIGALTPCSAHVCDRRIEKLLPVGIALLDMAVGVDMRRSFIIGFFQRPLVRVEAKNFSPLRQIPMSFPVIECSNLSQRSRSFSY